MRAARLVLVADVVGFSIFFGIWGLHHMHGLR
jgi:hypothetical protein